MTHRLQLARTRINSFASMVEYRARMGGAIDAAIVLIETAAADALQNLKDNPNDEVTKQAALALSTAIQVLDPLVTVLCPHTATPLSVQVPAETPAPTVAEAGHG